MKPFRRSFLLLFVLTFLSLTASGNNPLVWDYRYNGSGATGNSDIGKGICLGPDGNIYCTGQASTDGPGYSDLVIVSLNPDGTERWIYLYDANNQFDMGYAIAADADGNIYAAGDSKPSSNHTDFVVVCVDASGEERWVYRYDGGAYDMDAAFAITVGQDDNIYAAGICTFDPAFKSDICVVSLAPDGTERWTKRFNGGQNESDVAWSITTGANDYVYIAGQISTHTFGDFVVASFTSAGKNRWIHIYNGSENSEDTASMVIEGGDGNIYAVGKASETGKSRELTVVSLTPSGSERWMYQ